MKLIMQNGSDHQTDLVTTKNDIVAVKNNELVNYEVEIKKNKYQDIDYLFLKPITLL